ncbi:MAG TPA: hypothetical protein VFG68_05805 [Fimbriiglobus sp.]|nr:hypothetical protein [Fimbriiglobus sp.]
MPLKDHAKFHPVDQWSSFHSTWAIEMMARLNTAVLPERYKARPNLHLGKRAEVDVGTLERLEVGTLFAGEDGPDTNGGVATAAPAYAPPTAALSVGVAFGDAEAFEVQVLGDRDGWRLVAAVELVSESNKDRDESRAVFAAKCANYLASGVAVVVVDIVTERLVNLHLELCDLLDLPQSVRWKSPTGLSAICYRTVQGTLKTGLPVGNGQVRLDVWPHALSVGAELPTVPLWLAADLAVPLELDLTYAAACKSLRLA